MDSFQASRAKLSSQVVAATSAFLGVPEFVVQEVVLWLGVACNVVLAVFNSSSNRAQIILP
jgi:hypothetical protein